MVLRAVVAPELRGNSVASQMGGDAEAVPATVSGELSLISVTEAQALGRQSESTDP